MWIDRYLDMTRKGPMFLRRPEVAASITQGLARGAEMGFYELRAFVVMPNHVHILFHPHREVSRVLQWIKGSTAREANQVLARTGKPFWQRESYDHWVRNEQQFKRIVCYIENNPVKAGLAINASQYPWSSASGKQAS